MTTPTLLICPAHDCPAYITPDPRHVANLTACGTWHCNDHRPNEAP
ncbi:hypothetical protein [Nocardioides jishulii]|nr:hypothetical protein [Nocardioides jishulii]